VAQISFKYSSEFLKTIDETRKRISKEMRLQEVAACTARKAMK
jgi:hypothetical protein